MLKLWKIAKDPFYIHRNQNSKIMCFNLKILQEDFHQEDDHIVKTKKKFFFQLVQITCTIYYQENL